MKTSMTLMLGACCIAGWYAEDLSRAWHKAHSAKAPAEIRVADMITVPTSGQPAPMSVEEYARTAGSDPQAYRKFIQRRTVQTERGEIDKLMNFLARGKYE